MRICPKCNAQYNDEMIFCSHCGYPLMPKEEVPVCPFCGKKLPNFDAFCPYCGNKIDIGSSNSNKLKQNEAKIIIKSSPIGVMDKKISDNKLSGRKKLLLGFLFVVGVISGLIITSPLKIALRGTPGGHGPEGFSEPIIELIAICLMITFVCSYFAEKIKPKWGKYLVLTTLEGLAGSGALNTIVGLIGSWVILLICFGVWWKIHSKKDIEPVEDNYNSYEGKTNCSNNKRFHLDRNKLITVGILLLIGIIAIVGINGGFDSITSKKIPEWQYMYKNDTNLIYFNTQKIKILNDKYSTNTDSLGRLADVWILYEFVPGNKWQADAKNKIPQNAAFYVTHRQYQFKNAKYARILESHFYTKDWQWISGNYGSWYWRKDGEKVTFWDIISKYILEHKSEITNETYDSKDITYWTDETRKAYFEKLQKTIKYR